MYTKHKWISDVFYNFGYLQYLPQGYDPNKKYPLVFFLHGAGERGEDLELAARHGFLKHVRESEKEYPFILVAPQCPADRYWGCYTESLLAFLDHLCDSLPVDRERVYLTGLSMGGTGTWMLAMADPDRFAAIAPVCGSGIYWYGGALVKLPVYMYHGDCDEIVPIYESVSMLKSINKRGGDAKLEICYGVGHNAWDVAYAGDKLTEWLLCHKATEKPLNGFVKDGNNTYYYIDNVMQKGFQLIDGNYYYFSTNTGAMRTGEYTVTVANSNGMLTKNTKFHFDPETGAAAM